MKEFKKLQNYETFLLEVIKNGENSDFHSEEEKKEKIKKFIDRFQFLINKHKELLEHKSKVETQKNEIKHSKIKETSKRQNEVIKVNSEIRDITAKIEALKIENQNLKQELSGTIDQMNSYLTSQSKRNN